MMGEAAVTMLVAAIDVIIKEHRDRCSIPVELCVERENLLAVIACYIGLKSDDPKWPIRVAAILESYEHPSEEAVARSVDRLARLMGL